MKWLQKRVGRFELQTAEDSLFGRELRVLASSFYRTGRLRKGPMVCLPVRLSMRSGFAVRRFQGHPKVVGTTR